MKAGNTKRMTCFFYVRVCECEGRKRVLPVLLSGGDFFVRNLRIFYIFIQEGSRWIFFLNRYGVLSHIV